MAEDFSLRTKVANGQSLFSALDTIPEAWRPSKVLQVRRALCLDRKTREIYVANPYSKLILILNEFPREKLVAFLTRNNL